MATKPKSIPEKIKFSITITVYEKTASTIINDGNMGYSPNLYEILGALEATKASVINSNIKSVKSTA